MGHSKSNRYCPKLLLQTTQQQTDGKVLKTLVDSVCSCQRQKADLVPCIVHVVYVLDSVVYYVVDNNIYKVH